MKTPYQEAVELIDRHPGTGSSTGLAKLILSLWNADCAFSFRECVGSFDADRSDLALRIVGHFLTHGEDASLLRAGEIVFKTRPDLWDLGLTATTAKTNLQQEWLDEDRACPDG
jgi:hypothetical protein